MPALLHRSHRGLAAPATHQPAGGPSGEPAPADLVTLLEADHRRLTSAIASVREMSSVDPTDPQRRQILSHQVLAGLSQHLVATSWCVHPAARSLDPQGRALVRQQAALATRLHQIMRCAHQLISGDMLAGRYSFPALMGLLDATFAEHVRSEEVELLPALRAAVGEERMAEIGQRLAQVLPHCPTRAHPNLSFQSRWTPATARLAAAWDHVQDLVDSRCPTACSPAATPAGGAAGPSPETPPTSATRSEPVGG